MSTPPRLPFGRLVLEAGLATREQITACLGEMRHRQAHGEQISLGQVMVERGILTRQDVLRILKNQDKTIMQCERCGRRFNVIGYRPDGVYRCKYDNALLHARVSGVNAGAEMVSDHQLPISDPAKSAATTAVPTASATTSNPLVSGPLMGQVRPADPEAAAAATNKVHANTGAATTTLGSDDVVTDDTQFLAPGEKIIGRIGDFLLTRLLGRGGMGDVYLGRNRMVEGLFAIKILSQEKAKNEQYRERFLREARLANRLDHPNVVRVWDVGAIEGYLFIVMEYIEGQTLGDIVEKTGPMPVHEAVSVCIQALRGIEAAHAAGIIHRDLKPANIMQRRDGMVKVFDFGLALPTDGNAKKLTLQGQTFGTPHFMSPEQIYNRQVDHRTDIYSLGATLYFALCGTYPYPGVKALEVLFKRMNEKPIPILDRRPDLPPELVAVVEKLMADDPRARFESAYAARKALEPWAVRTP